MIIFIETYRDFFKRLNQNVRNFFILILITSITISAYNVLLSIYLKEIGFNEDFVGSIISLRTLGVAVGAIPVAMISGRISRKKTLVSGILLMFVMGLLQINTAVVGVLMLSSFLFGLGNAALMVLQSPVIFDNTDEDLRVTAFSFAFVLRNVAMIFSSFLLGHLSTTLAGWLPSKLSYQLVLNSSTIVLLIPLLLTFKFKDQSMCHCDNSLAIKAYLVDILSAFKVLLRGKTVLYLCQVALVGFGAGLIVPFFSIYLKYMLGITDSVVGSIMAFSQFGTIVGGLIMPFLSRRFGRVRTVLACQLLSVPFLISISFPQGIILIAISFFFRSSLMNMASPVIRSMAMEIVDENKRTQMSSLVSLTNNMFRALGIFVGGIIMYNVSYNAPYYLTIFCYLLGTTFLYRVFNQKKTA